MIENMHNEGNRVKEKIEHFIKGSYDLPSFWKRWQGTAEGALANLTEDIYIYPVSNNKFGSGYGIKYGDQHFMYVPGTPKGSLYNSHNDSVTSEELENSDVAGIKIMNEQIGRLIGLGLENKSKKPWLFNKEK